MTVDVAIKILNNRLTQGRAVTGEPLFTAIGLGVEALKLLQHQRTYLVHAQQTLLLGETDDWRAQQ